MKIRFSFLMISACFIFLLGCTSYKDDLKSLCDQAVALAKDNSVPADEKPKKLMKEWEPQTTKGKDSKSALGQLAYSEVYPALQEEAEKEGAKWDCPALELIFEEAEKKRCEDNPKAPGCPEPKEESAEIDCDKLKEAMSKLSELTGKVKNEAWGEILKVLVNKKKKQKGIVKKMQKQLKEVASGDKNAAALSEPVTEVMKATGCAEDAEALEEDARCSSVEKSVFQAAEVNEQVIDKAWKRAFQKSGFKKKKKRKKLNAALEKVAPAVKEKYADELTAARADVMTHAGCTGAE